MKKFFLLLAVAFAAFAAQAAQLTVFEGSATSRTVPINGYWLDSQGTQTQVIYPESALTNLVGRPINSMKFYLDETYGTSDCSEGTINISLGTVDQSAFADNEFFTDLTQVATISMTYGVSEIEIVFDEPFVYNGGNLVFDSYVAVAGNYGSYTYFKGVQPLYNSAKSRSQLEAFIPMTTFNYTPAENSASVAPAALDFGKLYPEAEATMSFTITNTGLNAFTPVLGAVAAPFSVETAATELAAGESLEVSVKFAPTALGDYAQTLTIDCGVAGQFEVALSGSQVEVPAEVVVAEGTVTNGYVPVYAGNYDGGNNMTQMIYTQDLMGDLVGKKLTGLKFHANGALQKLNGGSIQLSLKVVDQEAFTTAEAITEMTVVATGTPVMGETELVFDFNEPFEYTGGNLAVEALVTENGDYSFNDKFLGITKANASYAYYLDFGSYESNTYNFLPMATFSYQKEDTPEPQVLRGDVNKDEAVSILDVTALIDYLLTGDASAIDLQAADCNLDEGVSILDVTALIDYLLTEAWSTAE